MCKYLYGAACQGIQSYIFATNMLREIVGGSDLVERLCTSEFKEFLNSININENDYKEVIGAAGNIRYIFDNEKDVKQVVLMFPKHAQEFAPGITISQAVVKTSDDNYIEELAKKLRAQRNKITRPVDMGFVAVQRCQRTANPGVNEYNNEILDLSLQAKWKANRESSQDTTWELPILLKKLIPDANQLSITANDIPFEMEDMVDPKKSGWLAVIHADGNNLGNMFRGIGSTLNKESKENLNNTYKEVSQAIEVATQKAIQKAFGDIIVKDAWGSNGKIPIRPILIGGDDVTVICRADLGLNFTKTFLVAFQEETKNQLQDLGDNLQNQQLQNGLTACAGISFVKPKYPFHYAVNLAEELCSAAKKKSKSVIDDTEKVPSSLLFYKIRSSFVYDYKDICERELKTGETDLNFGPYSLEPGHSMPTIDELQKRVELLRGENSPAATLRQWLTTLDRSDDEAAQLLKRLKQVSSPMYACILKNELLLKDKKTPVADWLTILSLSKGES